MSKILPQRLHSSEHKPALVNSDASPGTFVAFLSSPVLEGTVGIVNFQVIVDRNFVVILIWVLRRG